MKDSLLNFLREHFSNKNFTQNQIGELVNPRDYVKFNEQFDQLNGEGYFEVVSLPQGKGWQSVGAIVYKLKDNVK